MTDLNDALHRIPTLTESALASPHFVAWFGGLTDARSCQLDLLLGSVTDAQAVAAVQACGRAFVSAADRHARRRGFRAEAPLQASEADWQLASNRFDQLSSEHEDCWTALRALGLEQLAEELCAQLPSADDERVRWAALRGMACCELVIRARS